jgi:hypothetical protein
VSHDDDRLDLLPFTVDQGREARDRRTGHEFTGKHLGLLPDLGERDRGDRYALA